MKAVLMMYKVFLNYPEALRPAFPKLKEKLEDPDPGVQSAAVNVICELARKNPKNYLSLAPIFFKLMTTSTNNWMLIKIIKLVSPYLFPSLHLNDTTDCSSEYFQFSKHKKKVWESRFPRRSIFKHKFDETVDRNNFKVFVEFLYFYCTLSPASNIYLYQYSIARCNGVNLLICYHAVFSLFM